MEIADWVQAITTVGFPIVAYLLVYMDLRKKMEGLTEAILRLETRLERQE